MHPSQLQEVLDSSPETVQSQRKPSLRALLIEPTDNTLAQFIRYTLVGGVAFAADFTTLFLLTHFAKVYYLASAAVAFAIGLTVNYVISAAWVFAHRTMRNRAVEFGIFAAVGVVGLGLNELGMWLLSGRWGIHYLWAKLLTAALVYVWNFGARKIALFR